MSVVALPRRRWRRRPRLRLVGRTVIPRQISFLVGAIVLVSLLVLGIVSLQAVLSETSFQMRALNKRALQLEYSYTRLKLTVAQLSSPVRIAREARRLGLRLPVSVRTLSVDLPPGVEGSKPTSFKTSLSSPEEEVERRP